MIKFEHTVFALPFAFMGMMMAAQGWPPWSTVFWITAAMVGARSCAMAFNRLVDRRIDALNPRTQGRELPAGKVEPVFVLVFVVASAALLVGSAWMLNPLAFKLSPLALLIIMVYSLTKRFTAWCHLVLGLSLAGAPLGAWIAVQGEVSPMPLLLAAAVLTWVAGFDILYALQDHGFDRESGLFSIPVRFGEKGALMISALLHLGTLGFFASLFAISPPDLGIFYGVGVLGAAGLLFWQHFVIRPGDLSRLNAAFFQANAMLSLWLFLWTAMDLAG